MKRQTWGLVLVLGGVAVAIYLLAKRQAAAASSANAPSGGSTDAGPVNRNPIEAFLG